MNAAPSLADFLTLWDSRSELIPWEVRYDIFVFPPDEPAIIMTPEGPMEIQRELSPEEMARRRWYLEIRALSHIPLAPGENPNLAFRYAYRVLWELVGDPEAGMVATTPRLKEWRENRASRFVTDLGHFRTYRPAGPEELRMFREFVEEKWPKGLKLS